MRGEVEEALLDVIASLSTGFEYCDSGILGELLDVGLRDFGCLSSYLISFIPDDYYRHISICMLFHLLQPRVKVHKSVSLVEVKHQNNAICTSVVGISDRSISFLASSVPNLQFDLFLSVSNTAESLKLISKLYLTKSTPIVEI